MFGPLAISLSLDLAPKPLPNDIANRGRLNFLSNFIDEQYEMLGLQANFSHFKSVPEFVF